MDDQPVAGSRESPVAKAPPSTPPLTIYGEFGSLPQTTMTAGTDGGIGTFSKST